MTEFATARTELSARHAELTRRLAQLEDDLERHGAAPEIPPRAGADRSEGAALVAEFVESLSREVGLIESALRRIESREYDCCLQCGGTIQADRLERLPYTVNCTACSADFPVDYVHQLRSHHSSLRRTVFNVLHALDDVARSVEAGSPASERNIAPALALLGDLARHLPTRFAQEERGGYLAEALAAAPRLDRPAARLLKQHVEFVRRTDALVKETERVARTGDGWPETRDTFRALALDLLAHEQAESDLLETAFLDDLGGID